MALNYDIEKLSLELILSSLQEVDIVKQYDISCQHVCIKAALHHAGEAFVRSFEMLHERYSLEGLDPVQFGQKTIRVCLKMSRERDFLYTLVACAFITNYVSLLAKNRKCFKFTFMAWKCLTVILKKKLYDRNPREVDLKWREFMSRKREINALAFAFMSRKREINALAFTRKNKTLLEAICGDYIETQCTLTIVDDCFVVLPEQFELTPVDAAFLSTNDIPEEEKVNFENLPKCDFCHQACEMFVHFSVKKFETDFAKPYTVTI